MSTLTINDNPSITDEIIFTLKCPDYNGCYTANPYKLNKLIIYFIERNFSSSNVKEYDNVVYNKDKLKLAIDAEKLACESPTEENIKNAKKLRFEAESQSSTSTFYFKEALPVEIVGTDNYPAWLSTDTGNSLVDLITEDENGDPVFGQYEFLWKPTGAREGDYFICWSWTPLAGGDVLHEQTMFYLHGDTQLTTSIPTHFTDNTKYTTLLDRLTPEMFKMLVRSNDRTPDVLNKLNEAVAAGFTSLENLTNQMVDLLDSNSISEGLIPYLSNTFNLRLKTNDPIRWRGQIKRAIPLFKMKGTKKGLREAFEHAAIKLNNITQLWEIISPYTWQESFIVNNNKSFALEKVIEEPLNLDNLEVYIRYNTEEDWTILSSDYVEFETVDGLTTMNWVGDTISVGPVQLENDDEIRIIYEYNSVSNPTEQEIENYIRTLPLLDQRDTRDQNYPKKNWNTRVIEESDVMFDLVIPDRNPFIDYLVYGKIRTEFPYSENIYNMEEYNGSTRNSKVPCDIDKNFISPCSSCISSAFNVNLEIENLSDDRIKEAQEVLKENLPFSAIAHTISYTGGFNEFVQTPIEEIDMLVNISGEEFVVSGTHHELFNRLMQLVDINGVLRSDLANKTEVLTSVSALAYNDKINLFCPEKKLDNIGMSLEGRAYLNILSPSTLEGTYGLSNPNGNVVEISSITEPIDDSDNLFNSSLSLNDSAFNFDIINSIIDGELCNIEQSNYATLADINQNFGLLGVKSRYDVEQGNASYAWTVNYNSNSYEIVDIAPDGKLIIDKNETSSVVNNATYSIMNDSVEVINSDSGVISTLNRGLVTVLNSDLTPLNSFIYLNNKFYFKYNNINYLIYSFLDDDKFYIKNYDQGDAAGVNLEINQKIVEQSVGYLSYEGLKLKVSGNLESDLEIQNGANSYTVSDDGVENNKFKENYIIKIDSDNYFITDIEGNNPSGYTTITLSGNSQYWKTLTSGGTNVSLNVYFYEKTAVEITNPNSDLSPYAFSSIDRGGHELITRTDSNDGEVVALSFKDGTNVNDIVNFSETVSYTIEYLDGNIEEGQI